MNVSTNTEFKAVFSHANNTQVRYRVARIMLVVIFYLVFIKSFGQSQLPNRIVPVSPEAASLAKIVNFGVSLNTGIPNISLPLYQVESGGLVLPIALDYHAGGFKINERSTSVGLGFSLSCDIQITRTINGLDDFMSYPFTGYIANSKMKAHTPQDYANTYPLFDNSLRIGTENAESIANGTEDGMPDKFNYKLLNKAGSFYFQKDNSGNDYIIVPVPFDNIKISYNNRKFTIIDTDGTTYFFDVSEQTLRVDYPSITSWKCSLIENATKAETIAFTYTDKSDVKNVSWQDRIEYTNNENLCGLDPHFTSDYISKLYPSITTYSQLTALYPISSLSYPRYTEFFNRKALFHLPFVNSSKRVIDKTYTHDYSGYSPSSSSATALALSQIVFRGGSVVFSGTDKLNSIKIKDAYGTEIRSFDFSQSYSRPVDLASAKAVNGDSFEGTLYLDALEVKSNGSTFERYAFQYQQKFCFGNQLKGSDAWGYPNDYTRDVSDNQYNEQIKVPHAQVKQRFYTSTDALSGCQSIENVTFNLGNENNTELPSDNIFFGILNRIVYPTGGYVDFNFESNKYKANPTDIEVKTGGGLHIQSINYYDGKSDLPISQKYYRYGDLEDGIGILNSTPNKNFNVSTSRYESGYSYTQVMAYVYLADSRPTERSDEIVTTYLPASSLNYTYSTGAPIYYTRVTEYNSDFGVKTGKKVHTFYPLQEFSIVDSRTKIQGTNIDLLRTDGFTGKQRFLEEYKYENGQYSLIHSKEFEYEKYTRPAQVKVVYSYFNTKFEINQNADLTRKENYLKANSGPAMFNAGEYGIEVGTLLLTAEREKWFKGGNVLTEVKEYHYDNNEYIQPSRIVTYNSKGQEITKSLKYSYDFNSSVYTQMKSKNIISQVIEEVDNNSTLNKEITRVKTNYGEITFTPTFKFIAPVSAQKSFGGAACADRSNLRPV